MTLSNSDSHEDSVTAASPAGAAAAAAARKVNRSCLECTRRKIKCDGRQPCGSCVYYKSPDACGYRQRSKRNAVSRSALDRVTEQLHTQSQILDALFPGLPLESLAGKTHAELLRLLPLHSAHPQEHIVPDTTHDSQLSSYDGAEDSAPISESGDLPAERRWEEPLDPSASNAVDDINGIGLATDHPARSYLGMNSMSAVLRAIFRLCPATKEHAAHASKTLCAIPTQPQPPMPFWGRDPALDKLREQRCIDFYFDNVHAITPMLDEADFRAQYASNTRQDASWMGLLNMVFAMGSIASGSDSLHEYYYRQARSFINIDSLGSGNIDSLQALCMLGGLYLHYRNSPNMAYSILGAAHRVAIALGLHREPRRRPVFANAEEAEYHRRRIETRRRTWWSFVCLDTWASMTQGRPTCGRWESTTMDTRFPTISSPEDHANISLTGSASFCLICDRIQHRFARFGRLTTQEVMDFDAELVRWYESLPTTMTQPAQSPTRFHIAREFMRSRYLNARMLLTRSSFLYLASGNRKHIAQLATEQQQLLQTCCDVASETIDTIALYWTPNRIHVWNSAWYLFQACMTPLLSLAVDMNIHTASPESVASWRASLVKALEMFAEMRPWMRASDRSPDIVSALYEALTTDCDGPITTPTGTDGSLDLFGWYDDQMSEIDWSTFLGGENFAIEGVFPT